MDQLENDSQINKDWFQRHKLFLATLVILICGAGLIFQWKLDYYRARVNTDFPTSQHAASVPSDWKTYTNTEYGFEFKYPPLGADQKVEADKTSNNVLDLEYLTSDNSLFVPYGVEVIDNKTKLSLGEFYQKDVCLSSLVGNFVKIQNDAGMETATYLPSVPIPKSYPSNCGPISTVKDLLSPSKDYVLRFSHNGQDDGLDLFGYNTTEKIDELTNQILSTFKFTELTSLEGEDSDNNGIRDDVQAYIAADYSSVKIQLAASQLAKAIQGTIINSDNSEISNLYLNDAVKAVDCLYYINKKTASTIEATIEGKMTNTQERLHAYLQANNNPDFVSHPLVLGDKVGCNFDPDSLSS